MGIGLDESIIQPHIDFFQKHLKAPIPDRLANIYSCFRYFANEEGHTDDMDISGDSKDKDDKEESNCQTASWESQSKCELINQFADIRFEAIASCTGIIRIFNNTVLNLIIVPSPYQEENYEQDIRRAGSNELLMTCIS
ncbi:hypothetical protein AC249_AIPGENE16315 [Exaiptasia diaphana]|nr:hypothetical protein AC249_AIPGENE16315 [Exaiptasia diaphana]